MNYTMNRVVDPLLSCEDNLSPARHEHVTLEHLTFGMERVSVKKNNTTTPSRDAKTVTAHPGQR